MRQWPLGGFPVVWPVFNGREEDFKLKCVAESVFWSFGFWSFGVLLFDRYETKKTRDHPRCLLAVNQ